MKLSRLILILLALVGGWLAYQSFFAPEGGPEFETEDLKRGEVTARVTATGTLEALTTVTVGSQVSGPVLKVQVDFNSPVEKGQILAELDPSEFQARVSQAQASLDAATAALTNQVASLANADAGVAQAEAQLEAARGQLEQTRAQVGQAEAGVESAEAGVLRARAEMDLALLEYKRYEELVKRDLVARSEVDQRRTAYRVGEAGYQSALASRHEARSTLSQAGSRVSSSQSEVKAAQTRLQATRAQRRAAQAQVGSARAQVRQAEANLRTALVDLDRATIRSPITGTVIDRKIDVGQTVQASFQSPDLFKIARDLRHMQVQVEVSEADIGSLKEGQKVTFKVDAHPDKTFEGRVTQVRVGPVDEAEQQDKSVVVYGVLVSAPNPDLLLRPGMTANVTVAIDTHKDVLLVPTLATLYFPSQGLDEDEEPTKKVRLQTAELPRPGRPATVWVMSPRGPESRLIRVGISDGEFSEYLEGDLKAGDKVVVSEKAPGKTRKRVRMFF